MEEKKQKPASPIKNNTRLNSPIKENANLNLAKRNSLIENNQLAKFFYHVVMKIMDRYVWIRSMILFSFLAFFLGNNLNVYLWLFVLITTYMMIYRIMRFWVQRLSLYLFEFCYFGLSSLLLFLTFFPQSKFLWYTAYASNTGIMSLAVIFLNNQANFNSTDHLGSAWLHCMPMITCWAIRWRHRIYEPSMIERLSWNLIDLPYYSFTLFSSELILEIVYPVIWWMLWAEFYFTFFLTLCKDLIDNRKYQSAYRDFIQISETFKNNFRNFSQNTEVKYLFQSFIGFIGAIPLAIACYYSFFINTSYVVLLVVFLIYNAGIKTKKAEEKKQKLMNDLIRSKDEQLMKLLDEREKELELTKEKEVEVEHPK